MAPDPVLRPVTASDAAILAALAADRWAHLPLPELAGLQDQAQRAAYTEAWGPQGEHIVVVDGRPVGRVWWADDPVSRCIVDVAILSSEQRSGLGTRVVALLIAGAGGRAVRMSVARADHRWHARMLDLGFEETASDPLVVGLLRPAFAPARSG